MCLKNCSLPVGEEFKAELLDLQTQVPTLQVSHTLLSCKLKPTARAAGMQAGAALVSAMSILQQLFEDSMETLPSLFVGNSWSTTHTDVVCISCGLRALTLFGELWNEASAQIRALKSLFMRVYHQIDSFVALAGSGSSRRSGCACPSNALGDGGWPTPAAAVPPSSKTPGLSALIILSLGATKACEPPLQKSSEISAAHLRSQGKV